MYVLRSTSLIDPAGSAAEPRLCDIISALVLFNPKIQPCIVGDQAAAAIEYACSSIGPCPADCPIILLYLLSLQHVKPLACPVFLADYNPRNALEHGTAGAVQTLMSVDADRVVNLCVSLHELWSLPAQIAIALYLLYTQVRLHSNSNSCMQLYQCRQLCQVLISLSKQTRMKREQTLSHSLESQTASQFSR